MPYFTQPQIDKIISFAFDAGEIAMRYQKARDFTISKKPDNTEVTSADIAISKFFNQKLSEEFPAIPIICEEGDLREFTGDVFWLIDPIDGTSSFITGSDEFAINIALIKNRKPIFGLLYGPRFEGGKMMFSNAEDKIVLIDKSLSQKVLQPSNDVLTTLKIVTSKKTKEAEITNYLAQFHPNFSANFSIQHLASAVKFFPLLENKADLYISFRKMMEWDTAAGQALIELFGGKLKSLTLQNSLYVIGDDLLYKKANFTNEFFACYKTFF